MKNLRAFLRPCEKDVITHENLSSRLVGKRSHQMKIRTGGRPAHYTVQRGFVKRRRVSLATIQKARANSGFSAKKTEAFVSLLRQDLGNDAIEAGLHNSMIASNHILDQHFTLELVPMEAKTESLISKQKRLLQLQKELDEESETSPASVSAAETDPGGVTSGGMLTVFIFSQLVGQSVC